MSPYMKRFIYASLFYLAIGTIIGALNGAFAYGYWALFAHTHFNLLGFMAMMVFGIGYFILPRFNGTDLRFPNWVAVHFWMGNISLVAMVLFRALAVQTGSAEYQALFVLSSAAQGLSIFMFVINVWLTLAGSKTQPLPVQSSVERSQSRSSSPLSPAPAKSIVITGNNRVAELIDALPTVQGVLASMGLTALASPGHLDHVRAKGVTLAMACRNHGLDLESVISDLQDLFSQDGFAVRSSVPSAQRTTDRISGSRLIGNVIEGHPKSRDVFQKHFGSGCFDCPGQAYESIDMACKMHGVDSDEFLEELNAAIG